MQLGLKRLFTSFYIIVIVLIATGNFEIRSARAAGLWYVKNGGSDSNDCQSPATACASINAALNKPGVVAGDTVRVAVGTYTGTGSEVVRINKDVTLSGGWDVAFTTPSGMATIDGQGVRRGIMVEIGASPIIEWFKIQNGYHNMQGGGVINSGILLFRNNIVINNVSSWMGGGIFNSHIITVTDSTISNNTGGNPCCSGGGGGGGISTQGTAILNNSTLSNNKIVGLFSGNAIDSVGTLVLNNSTISNNEGSAGEAIYSFTGSIAINNSTIVFNRGHGVKLVATNVTAQNTIMANNGIVSESDCYNDTGYSGVFTSLGYNLIKANGNCTLDPTDLTNVDPKLGPLQDNHGPTRTHGLLPSSPAISAGNPGGCIGNAGPLITDQRGFGRAGVCDIGAFELQPLDYSYKSANPGNAMPGRPVTFTIKVNNTSNASVPNILVTDTLPASLAYIPGSLSATSGNPTYQSGTVFWNGTLGAGQSANITFGATVNPATPLNTSIVNSATLNGGGSTMTLSAVVDVIERVFLPNTMLDYVPPPPLPSCGPGICGRVKLNGVAIGGVVVNLRFYNGSSWSTMASTTTASDGLYSFANIPSLSAGQRYYVRYSNTSINTRLSSWSTRVLAAYTTGNTVPIGDFDIANINLTSPAPGAIVSLPTTFNWNVRPATATDSYELNLLDYTDGNPWWWSPSLGYTGAYALNSLPAGFSPGVPYGWFVGVYSQDGGYGESYYLYVIAFSNTGNAPRPSAPARARPTLEDLPRPIILNKR
jgi:uncharacterized repeat protein (TIGR01451 family)